MVADDFPAEGSSSDGSREASGRDALEHVLDIGDDEVHPAFDGGKHKNPFSSTRQSFSHN